MSAHIATFATIFFSMILVNNYVLVQFLGICHCHCRYLPHADPAAG